MLWAGRALGKEEQGIDEAGQINRPRTRLFRKRGFIIIDLPDGDQTYIVERTACCQKRYIIGKTNCTTCPHRDLEERIQLARSKGED